MEMCKQLQACWNKMQELNGSQGTGVVTLHRLFLLCSVCAPLWQLQFALKIVEPSRVGSSLVEFSRVESS